VCWYGFVIDEEVLERMEGCESLFTCETVWKNNILPFQNLSQLNYPKDGSFEYWVADQDTGSNFRKHVSVERGIKWPDLPGK
jgi:hypothetical protein